MAKTQLTQEQLANIVELFARQLLEIVEPAEPIQQEAVPEPEPEMPQRSRPRYQRPQFLGKLAFATLEVDGEWFRDLAVKKGMRHGMLFNLMRQEYEKSGGLK